MSNEPTITGTNGQTVTVADFPTTDATGQRVIVQSYTRKSWGGTMAHGHKGRKNGVPYATACDLITDTPANVAAQLS